MLLNLKHAYWVKKTDLAPTEQFLEYSEKLIFHDGNDIISFSEYQLHVGKFKICLLKFEQA